MSGVLARVFTSTRHLRVESAIYRVVRVIPASEPHWKTYASAVLGFSFVSIILLHLLQRLQSVLPFDLMDATEEVDDHRAGHRGTQGARADSR